MVILLSENVAKLGIYLGTAPSVLAWEFSKQGGRLISEKQKETGSVEVVDGNIDWGKMVVSLRLLVVALQMNIDLMELRVKVHKIALSLGKIKHCWKKNLVLLVIRHHCNVIN